MLSLKRSTFVQSALASGQVSQDQIDEAIQHLRAAGGPSALPAVEIGDDLLASELVRMTVLTPYQTEQLKAGRTKLNLGPYVITDWIGQGGMGQVFAAVHQMMSRRVAIKVLPREKSTPEAIASFTCEIRTQARLDHPNLVRAYDAGRDGNVYFLVTEFVPGADLRRLVRSQGPLSMQLAASVIRQAALGLAYAHRNGLVHRDVKPGNILVTPEGHVKVSDLGLAGFLHEAHEDPRIGKIVGTADYLSPEKIKTPHEIAPISDIYSLGCTLYYSVTGKVPFPGGTTRDKVRRHCEDTPWHPRQFNAELSDEFVDLIADMMEKDPGRRIRTADEVASRLEVWTSSGAALPAAGLVRSRWLPPPLPTNGDETPTDFSEVPRGNGESDSRSGESTDVPSSVTLPGSPDSSRPERRSSAPPVPGQPTKRTDRRVIVALAITIPLAMVAGSVLTLLWVGLPK